MKNPYINFILRGFVALVVSFFVVLGIQGFVFAAFLYCGLDYSSSPCYSFEKAISILRVVGVISSTVGVFLALSWRGNTGTNKWKNVSEAFLFLILGIVFYTYNVYRDSHDSYLRNTETPEYYDVESLKLCVENFNRSEAECKLEMDERSMEGNGLTREGLEAERAKDQNRRDEYKKTTPEPTFINTLIRFLGSLW